MGKHLQPSVFCHCGSTKLISFSITKLVGQNMTIHYLSRPVSKPTMPVNCYNFYNSHRIIIYCTANIPSDTFKLHSEHDCGFEQLFSYVLIQFKQFLCNLMEMYMLLFKVAPTGMKYCGESYTCIQNCG